MRIRHAFGVAVLVSLAGVVAAQDDPVKAKLDKARAAYDARIKVIRDEVTKKLADREASAVKSGNKKQADQAEAELTIFEKHGGLPKSVDSAPLRRRAEDVRKPMLAALSSAVSEYTKARMKAEAQAAEQELQDLQNGPVIGFPFGQGRYLSSMEAFEVRTEPNRFRTDGTVEGKKKVVVRGVEFPTSIHAHPPTNSSSQVAYKLDKKWNTFRAGVAVPHMAPEQRQPDTPQVFEVFGDGRSLWKSKQVPRFDEPQWVEVSVRDVQTLTLVIHCPGGNGTAWSVWLNPRVSLDNLPNAP